MMRTIRSTVTSFFPSGQNAWRRREFYIPTVALQLFIFLIYLLISQGCTDRKERIRKQLGSGVAKRLRHDAAIIYKDLYARHGQPDFVVIWHTEWPDSFRRFTPKNVGSYIDGFIVALDHADHSEVGLFIVPESMDHEPAQTPGTKYEKLANGIYWYSYDR